MRSRIVRRIYFIHKLTCLLAVLLFFGFLAAAVSQVYRDQDAFPGTDEDLIIHYGRTGPADGNFLPETCCQRGFDVVGLFDADPGRVGQEVGGRPVEPLSAFEKAVRERDLSIGIITTPASAAQEVADRMVAAGITSILNFAPTVLYVPDEVEVRRVDLSMELQICSFYLSRSRAAS